ncbi:MAG: VWA domain-containing protein [Acidobacteriota bacterium]
MCPPLRWTSPASPPSASWLLALLLTAILPASVWGNEPIVDSLEVRSVELDVWITDRRGQPISGLGADDLELEVDGVPLDFELWGSPDPGIPSPVGPPALSESDARSTVAPPRLDGALEPRRALRGQPLNLVVLIDQRYLEPSELEAAREPLARFLAQGLGARDRAMLVTAGEGLEVLQPFTTLPQLVIDRLGEVRPSGGGGRLRRQVGRLRSEIQRRRAAENEFRQVDPATNRRTSAKSGPRSYRGQIDAFHARAMADLQITADQMVDLVRSLSGLPGRKAVLYLGGRLPVRDAHGLFEAWRTAFGRLRETEDVSGSTDVERESRDGNLFNALADGSRFLAPTRMFEAVATEASVAGVVLHVVDLSGSGRRSGSASPGDVSVRSAGSGAGGLAQLEMQRSLRSGPGAGLLALGTGGRTLVRDRGFAERLGTLKGDFGRSYVLSFLPPPVGAKVAAHRVEVRLAQRRRGAEIRHRRHVVIKSLDQEMAERTSSALLPAAPTSNPLEVEIEVGEAQAGEDGALRLPLRVRVPLSRLALVPDRHAHGGRLSVFFAAGGLGRGIGPVRKDLVPVRIANQELLTALGRRVDYRTEIDVPPGAGRIAVTVRDDYRPLDATVVEVLAGST